MSIFTKDDNATQTPPRNTFDGAFANNLTLKVGQITPCFCKEVLPGDSFKIDSKIGFSFDPMVFPVQTDMQASLHFFYVRNRALWKGWENFITKTENLEGDTIPPYIQLTEENRHMFETGEIGDYLGVPTMYYGGAAEKSPIQLRSYFKTASTGFVGFATDSNDQLLSLANGISNGSFTVLSDSSLLLLLGAINEMYDNKIGSTALPTYKDITEQTLKNGVTSGSYVLQMFTADLPPNTYKCTTFRAGQLYGATAGTDMATLGDYKSSAVCCVIDNTLAERFMTGDSTVSVRDVIVGFHCQRSADGNTFANIRGINDVVSGNTCTFQWSSPSPEVHTYTMLCFSLKRMNDYTVPTAVYDATATFDASSGIPNSARTLEQLPFFTTDLGADYSTDSRLKISAMPFRAVEAVYNSFYRDDRNNPLMIDGKPYYNIWVQNRNGGADTGVYKMYRKNWLADVFTTAVHSPQQGVMPLVGVTASGNMTFSDEEGKTYYLQAKFADDGHTIEGIESYSSDMPAGTLRAMVDTISTGISINDFRNVNALQRWLETNMRKGLRYKDQIEAHFGTSPSYSELQMPEFIGGASRTVHMSAIEQTVDTLNPSTGEGSPLGTLGGRASLAGEGRPVTKYCDEHGWIIGFISITPVPVYSQQLNKQLLKTELLDYYFPEFAHIGYQPILNREIAPLQCKLGQQPNANGTDDVFGYQRAWYEYLEYQDEVHGDYRTYRKDYLIHRIFNGVPKLGADFLTVSPDEANEVFVVQSVDGKEIDHIFGQIFFDVKMKRPFPKLGLPKLDVG